jgi:hypothetical protein
MGQKYSSISVVGFNSGPPSDDGSQTEANKVTWAKQKTKLADPLKTAVESVNTALVTALDKSARAITTSDAAAATDHDRVIQANTASVVVTLADAATMAAGYTVSVSNQSSGNITVALATSTDTIDTVTNTTVTLTAKEVRRYIVNAAATGYLTASAFGSASSIQTFTNKTITDSTNLVAGGTIGTPTATTSGTAWSFNIPSWANNIVFSIVGFSSNGTSVPIIQIGDAGGPENSGYLGSVATTSTGATTVANHNEGFYLIAAMASTVVLHGSVHLHRQSAASFTWTASGNLGRSDVATAASFLGGSKALSAALTTIRLTMVNGTDAGDAGAVNVSYW